jgi:hypothetical protein
MSVGNLKDYGNKWGNNFPYQLQTLQLLGMSQNLNLQEKVFQNATAAGLTADINTFFSTNKDLFLVAKSVVFDGSKWYAFITIASL